MSTMREELRKLFLQEPQVLAGVQQEAAADQLLEARKGHVRAWQEAEARRLKDLGLAQEAFAKAEAKRLATEQQLKADDAAEQAAYRRVRQVNITADSAVASARSELAATASPILAERAAEYRRRADEACRELRPFTEGRGGESAYDGRSLPPYFSNRPSIEAYMSALGEAGRAVEALAFEALTDEELTARLAEIEATIPDPAVMVEIG
jgi:hypothetical protein